MDWLLVDIAQVATRLSLIKIMVCFAGRCCDCVNFQQIKFMVLLSDRMTGPFCPVMRSDVWTIIDSGCCSCKTVQTDRVVVAGAMGDDLKKR